MSDPTCKTCVFYRPLPIIKEEGECNDLSKIILVNSVAQNDRPQVFEFSRCSNHKHVQLCASNAAALNEIKAQGIEEAIKACFVGSNYIVDDDLLDYVKQLRGESYG